MACMDNTTVANDLEERNTPAAPFSWQGDADREGAPKCGRGIASHQRSRFQGCVAMARDEAIGYETRPYYVRWRTTLESAGRRKRVRVPAGRFRRHAATLSGEEAGQRQDRFGWTVPAGGAKLTALTGRAGSLMRAMRARCATRSFNAAFTRWPTRSPGATARPSHGWRPVTMDTDRNRARGVANHRNTTRYGRSRSRRDLCDRTGVVRTYSLGSRQYQNA